MSFQQKRSMSIAGRSEIAARATWFLTTAVAGRHADKRTAQHFGVSVRMAQLLRAGQGWTLERLEQARRSFGPSFDQMVFGPIAAGGRNDLSQHVAEFEAAYERLRNCMVGSADALRSPWVLARDRAAADGPAAVRHGAVLPVARRPDEQPGAAAAQVKAAAE